ncbi:phosphoribosyltransferase family protein, partial [Ornithinicoccus halotolerans]|uniref:phosphoribosyltransferase family protein n=1 Tax=Ornithinicoccus halotolerans TaxID=1748220 RepID=UPI00225DF904
GKDAGTGLPRLVQLALGDRAGPAPVAVCEALRLAGAVRDQAALGARERHANLAGAVQLRSRDRRRVVATPVVVVDDVVTTGATLVACADALHRAGAASVRAATLAGTPRRGFGGDGDARPVIGTGS